MSSSDLKPPGLPRMWAWALVSAVLMVLAFVTHSADPGSPIAVSFYKAHLMSLGGWGGYWLDRALFPYDRPHQYLLGDDEPEPAPPDPGFAALSVVPGTAFGLAMLRRALVVAGCLLCVGLGA